MIKLKNGDLNIKNPNTGLFEPVSILASESAYDASVRNGFEGTEEEWLEHASGNGGYAISAKVANFANSLDVSEIGSAKNPVYIDENGKPVPTKYTLGEACKYNATDNPSDSGKNLVSTIALKKAMREASDAIIVGHSTAIVPSPKGILTYNGRSQSPSWANYNSEIIAISGTTSAVNAGKYIAIFTPISPNLWLDGTNDPVSIEWEIGKAEGSISCVTSEVSLSKSNISQTVAITRPGDGALRAVSSDTNIATVSVSGSNVIITGNSNNPGNATITVTAGEGTNYNTISGSVTIKVTAKYLPKIVTWADGTWDEISAMLDAHYAGDINISDYWSVGDVKSSHISKIEQNADMFPYNGSDGTYGAQPEQDINLVIIGINHDNLVSSINGHSKAAITVQTKNVLINSGMMSKEPADDYQTASWKNCGRYFWCNIYFLKALPTIVSNIVKSVAKLTNIYSDVSIYNDNPSELWRSTEHTNEKIFLLSYAEVFGEYYIHYGEHMWDKNHQLDGEQYEYMKTVSNRRKYKSGDNIDIWWLRTPIRWSDKSSVRFMEVHYDTGSIGSEPRSRNGIAPAFCL